ncbi:MAG: 2-hydroxychromene-2-carboxylate isomerase [Rhodovibrionaceae bacterium]
METQLRAEWFFDFISPYAYLQFKQLDRLPPDLEIVFKPVLFAGLLQHWGQLGPAEIPGKKRHTFLLCHWRARNLGIPFKPPPRHPFNPLLPLRLAIALGSSREVVATIFDHFWVEGRDGQHPASLAALAEKLGVTDLQAATGEPEVKERLKRNTEEAAAEGIFGVPSFLIDGQVFWGDDCFGLFLEWLADPTLLDNPELQRILSLQPAAERTRKA